MKKSITRLLLVDVKCFASNEVKSSYMVDLDTQLKNLGNSKALIIITIYRSYSDNGAKLSLSQALSAIQKNKSIQLININKDYAC